MKGKKIVLLIAVAAALMVCALLWKVFYYPAPQRAFYYWRTVFELTDDEMELLKEAHIQKLYIRFFDIGLDEKNEATALGEIRFSTPPASVIPLLYDSVKEVKGEIIPVVFITNRTLTETPPNEVVLLAQRIMIKVNHIAEKNSISFNEFQVDCDWTVTTREKYFLLLTELKRNLSKEQLLSCTIRLHQAKYPGVTGVPPVDRGALMFYNMGDIKEITAKNSVYNSKDALNYTDYLKGYPLPLDAALPVFSWGIHYSKGKVKGLVNDFSVDSANACTKLKPTKDGFYTCTEAGFIKGNYFYAQDMLKVEESRADSVINAALLLRKSLKNEKRTLILFDLKPANLNHYGKKPIQDTFSVFD